MADPTPCAHGMPTPGSCIDCMDEGNLPPAPRHQPVTVEVRFLARFTGHCNGCNLPVHIGQRLAKLSTGAYVHDGCEP